MNRKVLIGALAGSLAFAALAWGNTIKVWTSGERISSTDLNANFAHIHNSLRGFGHTLITNTDLAGGAAIAHSKLATPALVPKGWLTVKTTCPGSQDAGYVCTADARSGALGTSAVTATAAVGVYNVALTMSDSNYALQVQTLTPSAICSVSGQDAGGAQIFCVGNDGGTGAITADGPLASADAAFNLILMGN